ncbi:MAG: replication initiator protein A, partial [Gemmatimonadota bacterium]
PLFRLSDSADDGAVTCTTEDGGRWRVLPAPDERLPGTVDQDVYVEIMRRWLEAGRPDDGAIQFTLHAFLKSMGRRVDGRTYEQLRSALGRLERTVLESEGAWHDASAGAATNDGATARFTILSAVAIDRRRMTDRDQLALFPALASTEPGEARIVIAPQLRANIAAGHHTTLQSARFVALTSPVARRLYRLIEAHANAMPWRPTLERLAELLPLSQRFPSHLQRVLQPAHEMLLAAGIVRRATIEQDGKQWFAEYGR